MRILPKTIPGRIEFLNTHIPVWASDPDAVGLSPGELDELSNLRQEAEKAQQLAREAREAAIAATSALHEVAERMTAAASLALDRIKLAARTDEKVYVAAQIPVPQPSSPTRTTPPPGTPTNFQITLRQTGVLELAWSCSHPRGTQGTLYEVSRRVVGVVGVVGGATTMGAACQGNDADFVHLGVVSAKAFADESLPLGAASVEYEVTALRAGLRTLQRGQPARFCVQLGTMPATYTNSSASHAVQRANPIAA